MHFFQEIRLKSQSRSRESEFEKKTIDLVSSIYFNYIKNSIHKPLLYLSKAVYTLIKESFIRAFILEADSELEL